MAGENEPAKLLQPYLQRAEELKNHEPLVAYYCRLYAMEKGLKIPPGERTKTTNSLLVSLINQLERDKKTLNLGSEDSLHVEGFALNIFTKADKQDRAGRADINTAKTFYAASIFFEILTQFGPLQPDIEQKQKYALWKGGEIRKALKEGRRPSPGPPDAEANLPVYGVDGNDAQPEDQADLQSFSSQNIPESYQYRMPSQPKMDDVASSRTGGGHEYNPPPPPPPPDHPAYTQPPYHHQPYPLDPSYTPHEAAPYPYPNFQSYPSFADSTLPSVPSHTPTYYQNSSYSPQTFHYDSSFQPPPEKIAEAHKAARFAVGALAFDDVAVAVDYLKKSLELLTRPSSGN